jgi:AhpC/TSA family
MRHIIFSVCAAAVLWFCAAPASAARVGRPAPAFTARDSFGKLRRLSDDRGKFVVLEWNNFDCPFTQSQYKGKMQKLQQQWTARGVVWLRVVSSAPGTDGYKSPGRINLDARRNGTAATATLMDPQGAIGRSYGAKTTPHVFVINPRGILIYEGAVDNAPLEDGVSERNRRGDPYVNYLDQALWQAAAGRKVSVPVTIPYGCAVEYGKP